MNSENKIKANFVYQNIIGVWKNYCELHQKLYELTLEEYECLLQSNIDKLEGLINQKETLIGTINDLENQRVTLTQELNQLSEREIDKVVDIIELNQEQNFDSSNLLEKYNDLLYSVIKNIQDQNKTNQFFLNKAIHSINELKNSFQGKESYQTYNQKGVADR